MATITYQWTAVTAPFYLNNALKAGAQGEAAIAGLSNGSYFGAWFDQPSTDVRGRIIMPGDSAPAGEFLVNNGTVQTQHEPSVTGLGNGQAVVTFTDMRLDNGGDISARLFTAAGAPVAGDFVINDSPLNDSQSDVASLPDGGFVVSWTRDFGAGDRDIRASIHNADGSVRGAGGASGDGLIISSRSAALDSSQPSVAGLASGGFVVAWEEQPAAGGDDKVYFRRFNAAGAALDAAPVLIDDIGSINTDIQVASLPDGGFAVAYADDDWGKTTFPPDFDAGIDITVRVFNADGSPRSSFIRANTVTDRAQDRPSITTLANGFFVVGWSDHSRNIIGNPDAAFPIQQAFDANGVRVLDNFGAPRSPFIITEGELAGLKNGIVVTVGASPFRDTSADQAGSIRSFSNQLSRTITGDATGESLVGDQLPDTISGNAGNDFLFGAGFLPSGAFKPDSGKDSLLGGIGDDGAWGADGDDTLDGGLGNDGLVGGAGDDRLIGGEGDDFLFGGEFSAVNGARLANSGADTLEGGLGRDALYGFDGADTISGDVGNDYIEAGEGADTANGGADSDTILGQDGNDLMNGGTGFDYLYGGAGADIFVFKAGDSYDAVWDFSAAQGDKLRLDPALGVTNFAQFQAKLTGFTFDGVAYTVLDFPASIDKLTLGGIAHTAWTAAMVEFA